MESAAREARSIGRAILLLSASLSLTVPLAAGPPPEAPDDDALEAALQTLVAEDAHIAAIAYRLTTSAGPLCSATPFQLGLVLQARDQFAGWLRVAAERYFRLDDRVAISVVVPGSPAEQAGAVVGDRLIAVDDRPLPRAPASGIGSYATVSAAVAALDDHLATGILRLTIERDGRERQLIIEAARGCPVHVQLWPSPLLNAFADDHYATMTTALARATRNDGELAVLIGHEIAHAVLHHEASLNARAPARRLLGPSAAPAAAVLQTEREADRLGFYLAARAGYDIAQAQGLWTRLRAERGPAFAILKTHPAAREREAMLNATVRDILQKKAAGLPLVPDPAALPDRSAHNVQ